MFKTKKLEVKEVVFKRGSGTTFTGVDINGTLDVNGNVLASNFVKSSDARLKNNIVDLDYGIETLKQVGFKSYFKEDRQEWGIIAQDLKDNPVLEFMVHGDESKEMLSVNYDNFHALIGKSLIDLNNKVETLEKLVLELEKKLK